MFSRKLKTNSKLSQFFDQFEQAFTRFTSLFCYFSFCQETIWSVKKFAKRNRDSFFVKRCQLKIKMTKRCIPVWVIRSDAIDKFPYTFKKFVKSSYVWTLTFASRIFTENLNWILVFWVFPSFLLRRITYCKTKWKNSLKCCMINKLHNGRSNNSMD